MHGEHISRNYKRFAYHGSKSAVQRRGNATCPLEIPASRLCRTPSSSTCTAQPRSPATAVPSRRPRKRRRRRASLGKAFGHCEVPAVDEEGRRIVEPGQKGEIIVRGPSLALGYIGNREATEKAFAPNPLNPFTASACTARETARR
ncbi:MAG: AMP-binding protein [Eggerthella lenta]